MPKQPRATTRDEAEETVAARVDEELNTKELEDVSGGSGAGKRSSYNNAQQPWQATI